MIENLPARIGITEIGNIASEIGSNIASESKADQGRGEGACGACRMDACRWMNAGAVGAVVGRSSSR